VLGDIQCIVVSVFSIEAIVSSLLCGGLVFMTMLMLSVSGNPVEVGADIALLGTDVNPVSIPCPEMVGLGRLEWRVGV
jgi:hypothetical protein